MTRQLSFTEIEAEGPASEGLFVVRNVRPLRGNRHGLHLAVAPESTLCGLMASPRRELRREPQRMVADVVCPFCRKKQKMLNPTLADDIEEFRKSGTKGVAG